jgi:aminoglycoside phosphotransferase (APT) family kinase protein
MLAERPLAWVAAHLGSPVASATVLTGGVASEMFLLRATSGREAVLRQLTLEPWRRFADGLLRREYAVQAMLQDTGVPAPVPIAVDPGGSESGVPSLLMSRLPGHVDLVRADDAFLAELAGLLVRLHRFRPPADSWPRDYQSWAFESKQVVPPWSSDDALYVDAFARLAEGRPAYRPTFLHRDYYPANVLWQDGTLTGLVDWVETSTGPADLDVAHCASNLAGLHGAQVALAFRQAYVDAGGVLEEDPEASRYWQLLDLVGFLPDPAGRESGAVGSTITETWRANGRPDLTVDVTRRRREELLRVILTDG